jgi:hypothetical protein
MAVTYHSVSTTSWATEIADGNSLSIDKPSGLSVGDLMIAHIGRVNSGASSNTVTAPAGWGLIDGADLSDTDSTASTRAYFKVADSADVAASTFSFTNSTGFPVRMVCGAIYRVSGQYGDPVGEGATSTGATPSFANTVTPRATNNLLLMLITAEGAGASGSGTTYAIATSNPTWTERYDIFGSGDAVFGVGDGDGLLLGATATRPEITATGNSSVALTTITQKSACVLIEVSVNPNATIVVSPLVLSSVLGGSGSGAANVTVTPLTATGTFPNATITTDDSGITNQSKTSATGVVNQSKS